MAKIFVVIGKSSTGKDTIYQRLCEMECLGLKKVVGYTTRPIREGEQDGVHYFFVDEARLNELLTKNKVIEHRAYHTVHGIWNYFMVDDGQIETSSRNYVMIGTIESFVQIRDYYGSDVVIPIYIEVETGERIQRALNRERQQVSPKFVEMCRRCIADEEDFSEDKIHEAGIVKRYENNRLEDCIEEITQEILSHSNNYSL